MLAAEVIKSYASVPRVLAHLSALTSVSLTGCEAVCIGCVFTYRANPGTCQQRISVCVCSEK